MQKLKYGVPGMANNAVANDSNSSSVAYTEGKNSRAVIFPLLKP